MMAREARAVLSGVRSHDMSERPADDDQRHLRRNRCSALDAYWRAANYLSVGQIYLLDNPLLREPLQPSHIKPRLLGHWGTTPGQNFIYAHLNRVITALDLNMIYLSGPGPRRAGRRRQRLSGRHLQRDLSGDHAGPSRARGAVPAVLVSRRHPQSRRTGNAGQHSRRRRAGLFVEPCLRRGLRQSRPDCGVRDRRW